MPNNRRKNRTSRRQNCLSICHPFAMLLPQIYNFSQVHTGKNNTNQKALAKYGARLIALQLLGYVSTIRDAL
jgi:hypothetical protein